MQDEDFPPLPDPATPVTPQQRRRLPHHGCQRQPTTPVTASAPKVHGHGREKSTWQVPIASSKVVVIGDSNLSRVQVDKIDSPVNSVEIHSYPGARFFHLSNMFLESPRPQDNPSHVILSIGINSRGNKPNTNSDQIKQLISASSKLFPNAQIYIPQINYSANLPAQQRATLDSINNTIMRMAGDSDLESFGTIPTLVPIHFEINPNDTHSIHWTTNTANNMVSHWLEYLN